MGDRGGLHSLLEQINDVQRKDICDVAKGHLNENKLRKREVDVKDNFWASSRKDPSWSRQKVVVKTHPTHKKKLPPLKTHRGVKDCPPPKNTDEKTDSYEHVRAYSWEHSKKAGKEDIYYPETMVPLVHKKAPHSQQFIPNHTLLATKEEQYEQFKKARRQLLSRKQDILTDQDKAVKQIEDNMKQQIKLLESKEETSLPNYFKFKVYSEAWDQLNNLLGKDGEKLVSVKKDYDSYVSVLLEEQLKLDEQIHVDDYKAVFDSEEREDPENVRVQEEELRVLEDGLLRELKENEKLRKQIKQSMGDEVLINEEKKVIPLVKVEAKLERKESKDSLDIKHDTCEDLESQVKRLHTEIEDTYMEIARIKNTQREEYVPRAVCQRLEQSIKEIEVDTQKLTKQNDFLEQDIQELEEELERVLVKTGCKEKDAKLLWQRARVLNW